MQKNVGRPTFCSQQAAEGSKYRLSVSSYSFLPFENVARPTFMSQQKARYVTVKPLRWYSFLSLRKLYHRVLSRHDLTSRAVQLEACVHRR
jgi:hypothetical protein